jgi:ATP-dependent exoDNAse (exonuclease V) beta subunit
VQQFYAQDKTLRRYVEKAEAEAGYEALSLLYVALTRAKRAMYVLTKSPGKSESRNYPRLLASTLGDEPWSEGDARWYEQCPPVTSPEIESTATIELLPATTNRVPRRVARRPSGEKGGMVAAVQLLALGGGTGSASDYGTEVHALLAQVERGPEVPSAAWRADGVSPAAIEEAIACVQDRGLANIWSPPASAEIRREQAFEIVLDGAWVSGVFDRVIVNRGPDGKVRDVTVCDFKTDRVTDETMTAESVRQHETQMNLYRRVAAALWRVPPATVNCDLVFTYRRQKVRVPWRDGTD